MFPDDTFEVPDEHDDQQQLRQNGDALLSMQRSISAPGLLHITHNIGNDLASCCPELDEAVSGLAAVARCLQQEYTQSRIVES
eukprot:2929966-Pyramimonas_sp.AAC.1